MWRPFLPHPAFSLPTYPHRPCHQSVIQPTNQPMNQTSTLPIPDLNLLLLSKGPLHSHLA